MEVRPCHGCGQPHAFKKAKSRFCPSCVQNLAVSSSRTSVRRQRYLAEHRKYPQQAIETIRNEYGRTPTRVLAERLGMPAAYLRTVARRLGIAVRKGPWTDAELAFLVRWEGIKSIGWIAEQLGRSTKAVTHKMHSQGMSGRVREHMSARQLAACLGCRTKEVCDWIRHGYLTAHRQGNTNRGKFDRFEIQEGAIKRFLIEHPLRYDRSKADRAWLRGILEAKDVRVWRGKDAGDQDDAA